MAQHGFGQGDAAFRRATARWRQVKEDSRPCARMNRVVVITKNHQNVVNVILPPQPFVPGGVGQGYIPVIISVSGVITPSIKRGERFYRQMTNR